MLRDGLAADAGCASPGDRSVAAGRARAMLAPVDVALLFIAIETVVLAVLIGIVWERGAVIERVRELLGGRPDQIDARLRALVSRVATLEWQTSQLLRDVSVLADLSGVGVVRLDDDARVDFANLTAHVLLDRAPGSMPGQTAIEAFIDRRIEEIAEAARQTGFGSGELHVRGSEGPTYAVRARRSATAGVWLVLEDVSELRRLQRIRAEFIENLSHELRTPLSTVSLLTETLAREADQATTPLPPTDARPDLEDRGRDRPPRPDGQRAARPHADRERRADPAPPRRGPRCRLAGAVERLRLFAERQGVNLLTDLPPRVPPVRGDEERLGQVLVNLLHNAVKFSPEGGDVTVRSASTATRWSRPSRTTASASRRRPRAGSSSGSTRWTGRGFGGGGTGLGLSIARHVVEGHNGRIWVVSDEGRGLDVLVRDPDRARPLGVTGERPATTLVLAHRGDHRRWIENTADALLDACRLPGVDGVEFDVRAAADGEPIVLHDETLERTFGVRCGRAMCRH